MHKQINNQILTIYFSGTIDSNNSNDVEDKIQSICDEENYKELVFDFEDLKYISSAGLRILMRVRRREKIFKIINVPTLVYEIFTMTGFTEIMDIQKALRKISVEGCKILGQGGSGTVYCIDDDSIVKVFKSSVSIQEAQKERDYARTAFVAGLPTAIPYDIVDVDGKLGLVFEMIKANTLGNVLNENPDSIQKYGKEYAQIFKLLHTTELESIPRTKDIYKKWNQEIDYLTTEEKIKLDQFMDAIPERSTCVHGDFHPQNVMIQKDELLIIDLAELSVGHPIFDYIPSFFAHQLNAENNPKNLMKYLGITPDIAKQCWKLIIEENIPTKDEMILKELDSLLRKITSLKMVYAPLFYHSISKEEVEKMVEIARKEFFPNMDSILKELLKLDYLF